jgi:N-acetyl-anhydromuramyl-L-alanine amidase AmpD
MILKNGSKGKEVKELQRFLDIQADGIFGPGTERHVKKWQANNNLVVDGIVGSATWDAMGLATTDDSEKIYETEEGLIINKSYLPKGEYLKGPTKKEFLFLHHTAGWNNPYRTIEHWGRDTRGRVATEFCIGGQSIKGNDDMYDGEVVQAFPEGGYGWHLGKNGSQYMHNHSVGIEVNNFGYLTKGGYKKKVNGKRVWVEKDSNSFYTYAGTRADESQIVECSFKGYDYWHKYSDAQIESLRLLILHIADRDGIDVRVGLPTLIKTQGVKAFDWNPDAYYGKVKGLWTHTNTKKGKFDMFPQQELLDMLTSL